MTGLTGSLDLALYSLLPCSSLSAFREGYRLRKKKLAISANPASPQDLLLIEGRCFMRIANIPDTDSFLWKRRFRLGPTALEKLNQKLKVTYCQYTGKLNNL